MAKGGNFENAVCKLLSLNYSDNKRDDLFARTDGSGGKATRRRKKGKETANATGDIGIADVDGKPLIDAWCIECKTGYAKTQKLKFGVEFTKEYKTKSKQETKWFTSGKAKNKWMEENLGKVSNIIDLCTSKEREIPWDVLDIIDGKEINCTFEKFWNQCSRDAELTNREPVLIFRRNQKSICICFKQEYFGKMLDYFGYPTFSLIQIKAKEKLVIFPLKDFFIWICNLKSFIEKVNNEKKILQDDKSLRRKIRGKV